LIGEKQRLRGTPVADPFLIARAQALRGAAVTEESPKPNKPDIPAICAHFGIPCMKLGKAHDAGTAIALRPLARRESRVSD